jgi:glycosyltransferase involved in cell wall biosynthesis
MRKKRMLILGEGDVSIAVRFESTMPYLSEIYDVVLENIWYISSDGDPELPDPKTIDILVVCRSHRPDLVQRYKDAGAKIVYDLDDDFWAIDPDHPGYKGVGPGNPLRLGLMEGAIHLADVMTVSTPVLAARLPDYGIQKTCYIVPNGWNTKMRGWPLKPRELQKQITVGWAGTMTHRKDFEKVLPQLVKLARKHPEINYRIMGDHMIFLELLKKLSERISFFSGVPYQFYPAAIREFDILIAPLLNTYFNRAKSDIKLVEAGASYIPWVASDIPFYAEWDQSGESGILVPYAEAEGFSDAILKIVESGHYLQMAEKSRELANRRTADKIAQMQLNVYGEL